jgi:hypothetical protein
VKYRFTTLHSIWNSYQKGVLVSAEQIVIEAEQSTHFLTRALAYLAQKMGKYVSSRDINEDEPGEMLDKAMHIYY